jgi:GntR family transcriptional regulator, transcriptional repressor for pyruvate dehydrogenase complex
MAHLLLVRGQHAEGNVPRNDATNPATGSGLRWYQPLARTRLSDQVSDAIFNSIAERGLAPGDRLPTEQQLCEQFGVSKTVIREAVRSLEAKGVVRSGPGTGLRVVALDADSVSRSMTLFIRGRPGLTYLEVRDVRAMIEIETAVLAAHRATAEDVARLSDTTDRLDAALGSDAEYEADVAFHRLIADATHNELYGIMLDSIADVLIESRRRSPSETNISGRAAGAHRPILEAIASHAPERARKAMRSHLEASDRAYRQWLAEAESGQPPS